MFYRHILLLALVKLDMYELLSKFSLKKKSGCCDSLAVLIVVARVEPVDLIIILYLFYTVVLKISNPYFRLPNRLVTLSHLVTVLSRK